MPPSTPGIEIRTLGGVSIVQNGLLVSFRSRIDTALLLLLAWSHNRQLSRESLISLLWDRPLDAGSRHSLSQALYRLRRRLPALELCTEGDYIVLTTGILLDCRELLRAVAEQRWADAAALYSGPFLYGFNASLSRAFEQWCDEAAQQVVDAARRALRARVNAARLCGDLHSACSGVIGLIGIDPDDASLIEDYASLLAELGDAQGAAKVASRLPSAAKKRLGMRIRMLTSHTTPRLDCGSRARVARFVGRQEEFKQLGALWSRAQHGSGTVALIGGEAGIGKSRLTNAGFSSN